MTTTTPAPGTPAAKLTEGMAAFAQFLAGHPDLPLGTAPSPFTYFAKGDDDAQRAEVDRVAAILGVTPFDRTGSGTHWECSRDFGGGLTYKAHAITAASMQAYIEHMAPYHAHGTAGTAVTA